MKEFLNEDFLLESETAKRIYHDYAKNLPIVDFHCHLSPQVIYENRVPTDIAELWLAGDHYKWRLMRQFGANERYCTGNASGKEKFTAFTALMPLMIGNPIYHWAHLELSRYFGFQKPLSADTAEEAWEHCNAKLKDLKPRDIISKSNVKIICTTDDPTDDLRYHKLLAADEGFKTQVLPAFRPDKAFAVDKRGFADYIKKLSDVSGVNIDSLGSLKNALKQRIEYFGEHGCHAADHGLDDINGEIATEAEAERIFNSAMSGESITIADTRAFRLHMLVFLCAEYRRAGWVCELHFGVLRDVNSKAFTQLGPDTGFDAINPEPCMNALPKLLDTLERAGNLPKMLLFSINPGDNAALNTLAGCFPGRVQQGAAWWFNDTLPGMTAQLTEFASFNAIAGHIGMLTDSRSLLSYSRHEYFRRLLCNIIGGWVENGLYPADMNSLERIINAICHKNAIEFFGFGGKKYE